MCPLVESQAVPSEIPSLSSKAVATAAQKKPLFVALNSRSAIVLYVPTPQITRLDTGKRALSESCTKIGDVPKSPGSFILAALVPSVGTITLQIELRSERSHERPTIRALPTDP